MAATTAEATCPVPECELVGDRAHGRKYAEIERTVGRMAADEWDWRHEAFLTCDDCGRTDGTHDLEVEH